MTTTNCPICAGTDKTFGKTCVCRDAPTNPQEAREGGDIMQDIIDVFSGCGFEVRPRNEPGKGNPFEVNGSLDNAAVLLETVLAKNTAGTERFHWSRKGTVLAPDGFYVHRRASDDAPATSTGEAGASDTIEFLRAATRREAGHLVQIIDTLGDGP